MKRVNDVLPALNGYNTDPRTRRYLSPKRIVWTNGDVKHADRLLGPQISQTTLGSLNGQSSCHLNNRPGEEKAAIVLDFGIEFHGSARIIISSVRGKGNRANLRIRFGESVMEAMTDLTVKNTTNDHANRDMVINVGFLSGMETNESGYRFMRIDLLDDDASVCINSVEGVFIYRDLEYKGSFECNDPLINKIWETAAYTAHLNMQEYLWDGIKRDRLVWIGDMHTEVMTISSVFGYDKVVPDSLDVARDDAPITETQMNWMNGMPAYSLWWLLIHYDWYMNTGDLAYLTEQKEYLHKLLSHLVTLVDEDGVEQLPSKFLDWPNNANPEAMHAGMQGLLRMGLERGAYLIDVLGEPELSAACTEAAERMLKHVPDPNGSKSAGAILVLGGLTCPKKMNDELIAVNGAYGFSTFLGYYILKAKAMAGDFTGALESMREYWGGMLKMGATTFWEDFNLEWMENAAPIDEIVPEGKVDIHGDWGAYCYVKFRHSLCHGWSSGPVPFLTHYMLGINVLEPGCRKILVRPNLGDLNYVRGTYPTPYGLVSVFASKMSDGSVKLEVDAPDEVEIVY